VPSEIIKYIDSQYPEVLKELSGKYTTWRLTDYDIARVATVLMMVDSIPKHLIMLKGDDVFVFRETVETIRFAVNLWRGGDKRHVLGNIPGRGSENAMTILRKHLGSLSDEGAEPTTNELLFITDPEFRESLRRDLGSIDRSIANGEWKAGTVLGGSVIEAFLLYAVQEYDGRSHSELEAAKLTLLSSGILSQPPPSDLNKWGLHVLTEVASAISLIKEETTAQCRIAKDFRNLIHPGKAARLALECDRGTALSVLAAVEHVIRDLTNTMT
jgi:hypothetical protein